MKTVLIILMILVEGFIALPPISRDTKWKGTKMSSKNSLRTISKLRRIFNLSKEMPIRKVLRYYGKFAVIPPPPPPIPHWKRSPSDILTFVIKRFRTRLI